MPELSDKQTADLESELVDLDKLLQRLEDEKRDYLRGVGDQIRDCKERRRAVIQDLESGQSRLPL